MNLRNLLSCAAVLCLFSIVSAQTVGKNGVALPQKDPNAADIINSDTQLENDRVDADGNATNIGGMYQSGNSLAGGSGNNCFVAQTVLCGDYLVGQSTIGNTNAVAVFPCYAPITTPGEDMWYEITVPPGTTALIVTLNNVVDFNDIYAEVLLTTGCPMATCVNGAQFDIALQQFGGGTNQINFSVPAAGTYYITVDSQNDGIDSYEIGFDCIATGVSFDTDGCAGDPDSDGITATVMTGPNLEPCQTETICLDLYMENPFPAGWEWMIQVDVALGPCYSNVTNMTPDFPPTANNGFYDFLGEWAATYNAGTNTITWIFDHSSPNPWGDGNSNNFNCQNFTFCFTADIDPNCAQSDLQIGVTTTDDGVGATGSTSVSVDQAIITGPMLPYVPTTPSISCPANITVGNDPGSCDAVVNYVPPVGTDPCMNVTTVQTAGLPPGSTFPLGTTTNTFEVTNSGGNTAQCSFNVTVNDTENPTITCPGNIIQANDAGVCGAVVNYTVTTADNCAGETLTQTGGLPSGSTFPVGTTTNSFQVTDAAGNTATCSFDVTVNDTENPAISCPANINQNVDAGTCSAVVTWVAPVGTDNCAGPTTTQTGGPASGSTFPVGSTTITYEVSDGAGNTATCSFDVIVTDNENPTITCNADITTGNDAGLCSAVVTYTVTSADNCGGEVVTQTAGLPSGSAFPVGVTTNTFLVTDLSGNTATCSFDVTVNDTENPTISCPANISQCDPVATYVAPVGADNCAGATTLQTDGTGLSSGSTFPVGITTLEYTVTDGAGNSTICTFDVEILPADDASFTYPGGTYCATGSNPIPTITGLPGGTFSEGTGNIVFVSTSTGEINLGASTIGGPYTITYTTNGACPATATFDVTITLAPDASFTYPGTPFCQGDPDPFPTFPPGASAGIFSATPPGLVFIDPATGEIDLSASTPGIYNVVNDIAAAGGCAAATANSTIEIIAMDDSSFTYAQTIYCTAEPDPTANITGLPGGTFTEGTGSVVFLDVNTGEIDLSASAVGGPYTISYTTNGACPTTGTFDITITNTLVATITPAGPFCENDPAINLSAVDPGGTWGDVAGGPGITDAVLGTFDPALAGAGVHTIYYAIPGVCGDSATVNITVNAMDDPSFTYAQTTYCTSDPNPTPTITGLGGGTFTSSPAGLVFIDPLTGEIDIAGSTPGTTYTIQYLTNGTCPDSTTFSVTIEQQLDATITPVGPYCEGDPAVFLIAVDGGGTWSGTGIIDPVTGEFDPGTALAGTHTITYTLTGACGDVQTEDIIVNPSDDATITNPGDMCLGDPIIFLSAVDPGGTWSGNGIIDPLTGEFDPNVAGQGNVTVSYVIAGTCGDSSAVSFYICAQSDLEFPNVFTPNGDGVNDLFNVIGTNIAELSGRIYNRWGQVIYEWNTVAGGWDGYSSAGVPAPQGTYYFEIDAIGDDGTNYHETGEVTLLRKE